MAAPARVLVHVRRGSAEGAAPFGKSVTGAFCPAHEDAAVVNYALRRHRFLLSDEAFPGSAAALLQRPPFCPAKRLGQRGERPAAAPGAPGVAVAVATILQAGTGRILLTRRARGLSAFPGLWVPPAALHGTAGTAGGDGTAAEGERLHLESALSVGVGVSAGAELGVSAPPPPRGVSAAALRRVPLPPPVKEKLTADPDSEIATTSLRVSLMCPVGPSIFVPFSQIGLLEQFPASPLRRDALERDRK
ncbi:nucleoside diphosphate-linked moiety X motif 17 isoform X4 [Cuculus canorus]|uniref:nucleoside diphosphate-linked moiety X motif 17 isoform X4 n=1 Tax=Cuculus canorus TaxID=55661 RepID=UPI0023AA35A8|nr:nucleoside diphosphate-linked moiety X motif 17 isoform X4 [Cuculus canorus]